MATTVARLQAVLSADTGKFDRAMKRSETRMQKTGRAATAALAVGVGLATVAIKKSVDAALEAEKAETRLDSALDKVSATAKERATAQEAVNKVSRQAALDDEDLSDVLARLTRSTGSVQKAQEGMALAADIARARNVSLEMAAKGVERVMLGQEGGLSRLGVKLDASATATDVLTAAQEKFGGAAQRYGDSAAGAQDRFRVAIENLQEAFGKKLLPALTSIINKVTVFIEYLEKNQTQAKLLTFAIIGLTSALVAAKVAQIALNLAVLANPYVAATVAVVALAAGVYLLWTRVQQLRPALVFIAGTLIGLPLPLRIVVAIFHDKIPAALEKTINAFKTLLSWIQKVINGVKWLLDKIPDIPNIPGIGGGGGGAPKTSSTGLIPMVTNAVGAAREMGWRGRVTSGFRTYQEQAALYQRYLAGGPLAAPPGTSSHERGQAVDVTDYGTFGRMMARLPHGLRLYNKLGARDPVHFSVTGYDKGGWLPPGLSLAYNGLGRPEPVGFGGVTINVGGTVIAERDLISLIRNAKAAIEKRGGKF